MNKNNNSTGMFYGEYIKHLTERSENGDEEAKELLESHQSFIQRMKSNDKEAAFKNGKKNIMEELRNKLLDWAKQFETPDFIKDDPIFFPHKYSDKKDIEISAFLTSWIAFGNRKLIMQQAEIFG